GVGHGVADPVGIGRRRRGLPRAGAHRTVRTGHRRGGAGPGPRRALRPVPEPPAAPDPGQWLRRLSHPGRAVLAGRAVPPRRRDARRGGSRRQIALHAPPARSIHQRDGRSRAAGRPHGRTAADAGLRGPRARVRRGGDDSTIAGRAHPQVHVTAVAPVSTPARPPAARPARPAVVLGAMVLLLAVYGMLALLN